MIAKGLPNILAASIIGVVIFLVVRNVTGDADLAFVADIIVTMLSFYIFRLEDKLR